MSQKHSHTHLALNKHSEDYIYEENKIFIDLNIVRHTDIKYQLHHGVIVWIIQGHCNKYWAIIFPFLIWWKVSVIFSQISSIHGRRKEKNSSAARGTYLHMNLLKKTFSRKSNKGNDRNGASNKDEFHNNHYRQNTNSIFDERST